MFLKGTLWAPRCGRCSRIAGVLNYLGVEYRDVDVLAGPSIGQDIATPQLYIKGELVAGDADTFTEMVFSGELVARLDAAGVRYDETALARIREARG